MRFENSATQPRISPTTVMGSPMGWLAEDDLHLAVTTHMSSRKDVRPLLRRAARDQPAMHRSRITLMFRARRVVAMTRPFSSWKTPSSRSGCPVRRRNTCSNWICCFTGFSPGDRKATSLHNQWFARAAVRIHGNIARRKKSTGPALRRQCSAFAATDALESTPAGPDWPISAQAVRGLVARSRGASRSGTRPRLAQS